jgi:hypothetical protein
MATNAAHWMGGGAVGRGHAPSLFDWRRMWCQKTSAGRRKTEHDEAVETGAIPHLVTSNTLLLYNANLVQVFGSVYMWFGIREC